MEKREEIVVRQHFLVNIREFCSEHLHDSKHNVTAENITMNGDNFRDAEPVRDVEGDEEVVEAVLHVRGEENNNADKIASKTNTSNDNSQNAKDKGKLESIV